jgi:hypothetical protein
VVVSQCFGHLARGWIQNAGRDLDLAEVGHPSLAAPVGGVGEDWLSSPASPINGLGASCWRGCGAMVVALADRGGGGRRCGGGRFCCSALHDLPWWRGGCRVPHRPLLP